MNGLTKNCIKTVIKLNVLKEDTDRQLKTIRKTIPKQDEMFNKDIETIQKRKKKGGWVGETFHYMFLSFYVTTLSKVC